MDNLSSVDHFEICQMSVHHFVDEDPVPKQDPHYISKKRKSDPFQKILDINVELCVPLGMNITKAKGQLLVLSTGV